MSADRQVWTYVATKDGKFAGAISGRLPGVTDPKKVKAWKKDIAEFCGGFIADGFDITKVYSSEEYTALITGMPIWERPKPSPPPLFPEEISP